MNQPSIILTGFMGVGKSTVGRILAERTNRAFVDTDEWIESVDGRPVSRIFAESGETHFRRLEAETAQRFAGRKNLVLATGGRLMLDQANAALLGKDAHIICLHVSPAEILRRLSGDSATARPLLAGNDPAGRLQALLDERAFAYARFTQFDGDGKSAREVAEEILNALPSIPIPLPEIVPVKHPAGQYDVIVGQGVLSRWRTLAGLDAPTVLITDSNVGPLHAQVCGLVTSIATMPAGEKHKTLSTVQQLYDQLLDTGLDRAGAILALGGGVVGDVAGFVAATYLRGVPVIQCPTSLLAMVDASVGGKTGVDLPQGKNLVGAFKQPQAVMADISTLATLPPEEFTAGLAEVVKSGLISAPALLSQLEAGSWRASEAVQPAQMGRLQKLIAGAIQVKRDVVQEDPFEKGRRALLNLGHTFAHAIEQVSHYRVRHGEAVAMGLVAAANLSARGGHCRTDLEDDIVEILRHCGLPQRIPAEMEAAALLKAMHRDKKKEAGQLRFVLLRSIGDAFVSSDVEPADVLATLRAMSA